MKSIVITGGTGGLGTVVVKRLSRDYHCILLYRNEPPEAAENIQGIRADLADEESVKHAFAHIENIYALVHLAGGFALGKVADTTTETWSNMLSLNVSGAFIAAREALPKMTRPGRIIAISSVAAIEKKGGSAAYTVSKSALNILIEIIAKENPEISANVLAPSTLTDELRERVAETIAFLLSDDAAGISGATIPLR